MKLLLSSNLAILHIRIESSNNRRIYTGQSYYEIESPFEQQMEMKDLHVVPYFAVFSLNFTQFELSFDWDIQSSTISYDDFAWVSLFTNVLCDEWQVLPFRIVIFETNYRVFFHSNEQFKRQTFDDPWPPNKWAE